MPPDESSIHSRQSGSVLICNFEVQRSDAARQPRSKAVKSSARIVDSDRRASGSVRRSRSQSGPPTQRVEVVDLDLASFDADRTASRQALLPLRPSASRSSSLATRAARSRNTKSVACSVRRRTRAPRERNSTSKQIGLRCIKAISAARPITIPVVGLSATTDADLGPPSITDSSPTTSDGPSVARSISSP